MRHRKIGRVLGRNPNHQRALLRNLTIGLIFSEKEDDAYDDKKMVPKVKGRIITTLIKAKEVRPFVEKCITLAIKEYKASQAAQKYATKAERGSAAWKTWREGEGWKEWVAFASKAVAYRRRLVSIIGSKEAAAILVETVAPRYVDRAGGYTRILKLAKPRLGDAAPRAVLEFVGKNDRENVTTMIPKVEV